VLFEDLGPQRGWPLLWKGGENTGRTSGAERGKKRKNPTYASGCALFSAGKGASERRKVGVVVLRNTMEGEKEVAGGNDSIVRFPGRKLVFHRFV